MDKASIPEVIFTSKHCRLNSISIVYILHFSHPTILEKAGDEELNNEFENKYYICFKNWKLAVKSHYHRIFCSFVLIRHFRGEAGDEE